MRESLKWIVIYIWYHLGLNSVLHFGQTYVFDMIMTYKMTNRINTGIAIKYHGTSKWLPNQLTWQEDSIRVEMSKSKEINIFFISSPPFWFYCNTVFGVFQYKKRFSPQRKATLPFHYSLLLITFKKFSAREISEKWRVKSEKVKNSAHLRVRDFLRRVDKKDAIINTSLITRLQLKIKCRTHKIIFFVICSAF